MRCLIVPPADYGSIGDRALVQALVQELTAAGHECAFAGPSDGWENVCTVVSPNAFHRYDRLYVIGADVLDGSYGYGDPQERVFRVAERFNVNAIICSFSVRKEPHPRCMFDLKNLHSAGVRFALRDVYSWQRFERFVGSSVLASDLSFLLSSEPAPEVESFVASRRARGTKVIGVNLNALVRHERIDEFARRLLAHNDWDFVVVPHDFRQRCSDLPACRGLADQLGERCLLWVPSSPASVKGACKCLDVVLTGRMHLAAAALGVGTPAVAIDYNDKAKGMFAQFYCENLAMTLTAFSINAVEVASTLLAKRGMQARIAGAVPEVRRRARLNLFLDNTRAPHQGSLNGL